MEVSKEMIGALAPVVTIELIPMLASVAFVLAPVAFVLASVAFVLASVAFVLASVAFVLASVAVVSLVVLEGAVEEASRCNPAIDAESYFRWMILSRAAPTQSTHNV